ncbi:MAG: Gfo/Idh/MocA family protein [Opitutaceae bacterium]
MKSNHLVCLVLAALAGVLPAAEVRVGLVDLDTSRVPSYTKLLNDEHDPKHVKGARVVAGFPGGSPDIPEHWSRLAGYVAELKKQGVAIVDSLDELLARVDAVIVTGSDGRRRLAIAEKTLRARKPLFIDKPLAASLRDVVAIFRLGKELGVPVGYAESYRYRFMDAAQAAGQGAVGELRGAVSFGPAPREAHHPDLFWYGVHTVEALYAVMGRGCESVVRTATENTDVVTGTWRDGRVGTMVGLRNMPGKSQVTLYGAKGFKSFPSSGRHEILVSEIVAFFRTGKPPVPVDEVIEVYSFMEAADESKRRGGTTVQLSEVLRQNGG